MAKTKVELQNYQGESLSPITIASNVLYEDGRNAQEVFEEYSNETFTPTIENSSSMFKVGQGDSVDYSSNVVNGAYESMVLKGKSMVNCIQEPSSQDVVLPYEFEEGQYVTINDTKESGALGVKLKGQTLVNLSENLNTITRSLDWWYREEKLMNSIEKLKRNTYYTILYRLENISGNHEHYNEIGLGIGMNGYDKDIPGINDELDKNGGWCKIRFQLTDDFIEQFPTYKQLHIRPIRRSTTPVEGESIDYTIKGFTILEGDYITNPIPFNKVFEGMQSVKMLVLRSVGKNLATVSNVRIEGIRTNSGGHPKNIIMKNIPVEEGKTYTISGVGSKSDNMNGISFTRYEHQNPTNSNNHSQLWDEIGKDSASTTFTIPKGIKYVSFTFGNCVYNNNGEDGWLQWDNIQLEEGSTATSYESYKTNILTVNEPIELRGIGNVRDELDLLTGEMTQRIGEIVLDETLDYQGSSSANGENTMYFQFDLGAYPSSTPISHYFKVSSANLYVSDNDYEAIRITSRGALQLRILKSKLPTTDTDGVKEFFKQNNISIQYQLAQESIKTVDLNVVDQNGSVIPTLKSWNTTTHIYSEIPENSLHPILSHSNPSYPVILKPSTKYSIVANSYSNSHTNSTINFNLGGATASTTVGNRVTTITTPSTLSNELLTMSGRGNKLNNVMVIEGDVVGDEPYFEGICDSKSPILSNVGKNLFDANNQLLTSAKTWFPIKNNLSVNHVFSCGMELPYIEFYGANSIQDTKICYQNWDVIATFRNAKEGAVTSSKKYKYLIVAFDNNKQTLSDFLPSLQVEILEKTSYESYKSNILSCETYFDETTQSDKTIVLRSLPNGVCDTLNVETGEYVQRIGEIVLDGNEEWSYVELNNTFRTSIVTDKAVQQNDTTLIYVISDKYTSKSYAVSWNEGKFISLHTNKQIVFRDENFPTLVAFKQWLSQNPTTVQYELATPVVSTIDVQGFPYAYANGHVQLSSGSIEQSLTPTVEYSVATNRNGQIRTNQKMVEKHQQHLDQLQAMIISNMVNTQYQQTLTTLNYDLLKKEVGE